VGEAISQAMGYDPSEFLNAYYENIGRQNIETIESHPLAHAIAKYFEEQEDKEEEQSFKVLEGSPMEVLEALEAFAQIHKINTDNKQWPKSPSALSRRLNQIRSNLLEGLGIEVTISRKNKSKANTAYIEIRKMPPMSPIPPVTQNHEGNNSKTIGGIPNTGDIMPPANKIPPIQTPENHAQKSATGDTGGIGDILPCSGPDQLFEFQCYYCDSFNTNSNDYYEDHTIMKHGQRHPCYPSKADLEKLGLKPQGKSWEI
jgi:hypothetical protein